jgi:hypothetical protein
MERKGPSILCLEVQRLRLHLTLTTEFIFIPENAPRYYNTYIRYYTDHVIMYFYVVFMYDNRSLFITYLLFYPVLSFIECKILIYEEGKEE